MSTSTLAVHGLPLVQMTTKELVQAINDTGVLWWSGSFTGEVEYLGNDIVKITMANEETGEGDEPTEFVISGEKLADAFSRNRKHLSFQVRDGKVEDFDIDASVADRICQTATYGEVRFG